MPHGSLPLPAALCLLTWDTPGGEAMPAAHVVRAGALTELVLRGLLIDDDGIATPVDLDSAAGDAVLDGLLELVRESRPHRWRTWVTLHARVTYDAAREQLTAEGCLRAEKKRVLGVFPSVEHVLEDTARAESLREEARRLLQERLPEPSDRQAAFAALAAAADPGVAYAHHEQRLEELITLSGAPTILTELCTTLTTPGRALT